MNVRAFALSAALAAAASLAPWAAVAANDATSTADERPPSGNFTLGEIKKVDVSQGKLTIKHGPIENLGMPGMTMVFRADASVLAALQAGDQVKFKADKVDGAIRILELEK